MAGAIVTRAEWDAVPPRDTTPLVGSQGVAVHWEGPRMGWPWPHSECAAKVRSIQRFHMVTRGWLDVAYNFLVCGHGYRFEGRGWGVRSAANGTNEGNAWGHAVCYLAGDGDAFTAEARTAIAAVAAGHRRLYGQVTLRPHSSFRATACPGDAIRAWIPTYTTSAPSPAPPPTPTPAPAPTPTPTDKGRLMYTCEKGDKGPRVVLLQETMRRLGWAGDADGSYGPATVAGLASLGYGDGMKVGPRRVRQLEDALTAKIATAQARKAVAAHRNAVHDPVNEPTDPATKPWVTAQLDQLKITR
jgi:hypothetical protein